MKNKTVKTILNNFETINDVITYKLDDSFKDLIYKLHDGLLPNNVIYSMVHDALISLSDLDLDNESLESVIVQDAAYDRHISNSEALEHFKLYPGYANDYMNEFLHREDCISSLIVCGYESHLSEIIWAVYGEIENISENINPSYWFTSTTGVIEFQLTKSEAESVSHSGDCYDSVKALIKEVPEVMEYLNAKSLDLIRSVIIDYGFELSESEKNDKSELIVKLLWLAGCEISENN